MDASGYSQVGRYGTLSLMKRQEADAVVTGFGIDNEELTFGRDPGCSVRLYYPDINLVHCKIIFEDRKAFLIVLGSAGLLVDGCRVYPNGTPAEQPTIIPLSNDSEIEIHNKRFRFSYPPKEMRAALLATPAQNKRRLRLSMIQSAQVFSPRPSKDPRENLRILKSPMKNTFRSPTKPSALSQSPITSNSNHDHEDEELPGIVLVDGNHPRVVEEDEDLVILEDVEAPASRAVVQAQPPKTPQRRRSQSLHRAVLIRSAQRRVIEHETQRQQEEEEREEEMEVLDTISTDDISSEDETSAAQHEQAEHPPSDEDSDSDEYDTGKPANQEERKSLWRKSFEKLWPFGGPSPTEAEAAKDGAAEHEEPEESSEEEDEENERNEGQDQPEAFPSLHQPTPIRRPMGSFMTPQVGQKSGPFGRGESLQPSRDRLGGGPPVRYSMGGEARRVPLVETAWRVKDLVVPLEGESSGFNRPAPAVDSTIADTPRRSQDLLQAQPSLVLPRSEVSMEERKAIQERRRSALREVDSHSYFVGGIPGMSPSKATTSPVKPGFNETNNPFRPVSPTKMSSIPPVKDINRRLSTDEEGEKLDTRSLLERMKETVEGMKRRRSTIGLPSSSPIKASHDTNSFNDNVQQGPEDDADKENNENSMDVDNPEPFVLLRSPRKNFTETQAVEEKPEVQDAVDTPVVPVIVETIADEQTQPEEKPTRPAQETWQSGASERHSRTRSRGPQPPAEPVFPAVPRRTRKAAVESEDVTEAPDADVPKRNTRKATRTADYEESARAPAAATTQTRRARKATVEPEEPQPTRRGRKIPTTEEQPAVPATKRNLRKVAVKEETEDSLPLRRECLTKPSAEESSEPTKRSATRTRVTKTAPQVDTADADDPLDAFNEPEEASAEAAPSKTAAKGRRARKAVKQEESTKDVLKASTRSRVSTATTTRTPATQTRGRPRKTPATAPAAPIEVDKENTPGDIAPVTTDGDEGVMVKVRTTRKTKIVPVKQETGESTTIAAQPKTRAPTRTTRSRTRTT